MRYGILPAELKERMTATDFWKAVAVLEAEPNKFDKTCQHLGLVAWKIDQLLYVVSNMFKEDPPAYDKTLDDFVLEFTKDKPATPAAGTVPKFKPPVIRGGKVVTPGEGGPAQSKRPVYTGPPRHVGNLSPEQEAEAREAISRAVWGSFAKQAKVTSINDRKKSVARNPHPVPKNGRGTPGRPAGG